MFIVARTLQRNPADALYGFESLASGPRNRATKRPPRPMACAVGVSLPKLQWFWVVTCVRHCRQGCPDHAIGTRERVEVREIMPEVIFTGAAGRIEGRYHPARQKNAPIGIVLHPHPQFGGTMNHQIIYQLYYAFVHRNFSVLRFNFRGVGRSQGAFDHGQGELSDAASALDWSQTINPEAKSCWIAGFSFGAWIGMQLLMRRPEIEGFISICPPANLYDFSFLAPCPSSGLIIHGDKHAVVPAKDVTTLVDKLKTQKGIVIEQKVVQGANHFFDGKVEALMTSVNQYLDKRLVNNRKPSAA